MRKTKIADRAVEVILGAFGLFLVFALSHGFARDLIMDEMHERGACYFCDLYRFTNSDDAAFQTRELRRSAK